MAKNRIFGNKKNRAIRQKIDGFIKFLGHISPFLFCKLLAAQLAMEVLVTSNSAQALILAFYAIKSFLLPLVLF